MRRVRDIRDHRQALLRKAALDRRKQRKVKAAERMVVIRKKRREKIIEEMSNRVGVMAKSKLKIKMKGFDEYILVRDRPIKICHAIDSLGVGGGQTMMLELIGSFEKYYPDKIENTIVCPRSRSPKSDKTMFSSYGYDPISLQEKEFTRHVRKMGYDIILHHRLANAQCIKSLLPDNVKYVLLNHTYHQLAKIPNFLRCDLYITVCKYLDENTRWPSFIHPSRRLVILNGVENDYLKDIEPRELEGGFKTGRCHRLVHSKFKADSLIWMQKKVVKQIPGYAHFLIGFHPEAKKVCKKSPSCNYMGPIVKRKKKMSIIKALDVYFYETFQNEGASVAILEALACGVPVLCRNYGGNSELITNGVNGYIVKERDDFLLRMKDLASSPEKLKQLKETTLIDFNKRLHIKHAACKYVQSF